MEVFFLYSWVVGGKVQNIGGGEGGGANFSLALNWSEPPPPIIAI